MRMHCCSVWIPAAGAQKDLLSTRKNAVIAAFVPFIVRRNA
jgi:hypothetical protein